MYLRFVRLLNKELLDRKMDGAKKSNRLVFMRSGGIGDFLLTFPLFSAARNYYDELILFSKREYLPMVAETYPWIKSFDLDSDYSLIFKYAKQSHVISFWKDQDWKNDLIRNGAYDVKILDGRPSKPPHIVTQMFQSLGWKFSSENLQYPWLKDSWKMNNQVLWIHPGSGSKNKNTDFQFFEQRARTWISKHVENKIIFSFGEADEKLNDQILNHRIFCDLRVECRVYKDLIRFKNDLISTAVRFLGNDSGPTHMSAMLGLPTEVYYRITDSKVWRPMGPRVEVYDFESEASKIL